MVVKLKFVHKFLNELILFLYQVNTVTKFSSLSKFYDNNGKIIVEITLGRIILFFELIRI